MDETSKFDFGTNGKSKEEFVDKNSYDTSDLNFLEGNETAIDGLDDGNIIPVELDINYSNGGSFSDIFHVGEEVSEENFLRDGDFNGELTEVSNNVIDNSGFDIEHNHQTVLEEAKTETAQLLGEFSQDNNLEAKLEEVFGEEQNFELTQKLLKDVAQEGSLSLPTIEVLASEVLGGANGGYAESTETIYLSDDFLTQNENSSSEVSQVLIEEFGHYIDDQVNDIDTPGDEGAIFADIFNLKPSLSEDELAAISVEDDFSTIIVGNQLLEVENNIGSYPGYIFKYEEGQSLTYDSNVEDWQEAMNDLGWNIQVDGLYGPESKNAALEFQQQHDDLTNDGIVGVNTWNKILDLLDDDIESPPTESTPFSGTADNAERNILEEREQLPENVSDSDNNENPVNPDVSNAPSEIQKTEEIQFNLDNVGLWGKNKPFSLGGDLGFSIGKEWENLLGFLDVEVGISGGISAFASLGTIDLELSGSFDYSFDHNSRMFTVKSNIGTGSNLFLSRFGVGLGVDLNASVSANADLPLGLGTKGSISAGFDANAEDVLLGISPLPLDIDPNLEFKDSTIEEKKLEGTDTIEIGVDIIKNVLKKEKLKIGKKEINLEDYANLELGIQLEQESTLSIVGFGFDQDGDGEHDFTTDIGSSKTVELTTDVSNLRVQPIVNLNTTLTPQVFGTGSISFEKILKDTLPDILEKKIIDNVDVKALKASIGLSQNISSFKIDEFNPFAEEWVAL